jgi:predicted esterase
MNMFLNRMENALKALEYGMDRGIWYGKYTFLAEMWKPLTETEGFQRIQARNESMLLEAQKNVSAEYRFFPPEGFTENKKFPLFIALHGGGENLEGFIPEWTSSLMKKEFVVAYPQSSQQISMSGFNWTEDLELSKKEIQTAYQTALERYPIDTGRVIIGGFSSGGVAALVASLEEIIPSAGFIVLCPAKPETFTNEIIRAAKNRGLRGTLITTEMDGRIDSQKEMARIMEEEGFPHVFIVTPNIGHWYPTDLGEKIDAAIKDILKK